jgi:hypothetical protein
VKQKELTAVGKIFLVVWIVLCMLIVWALSSIPVYKPTIINFTNLYTCEKVEDQWIAVSSFNVGQDIYLCGNIRLSDSTQKKEIQVRVYEGERAFYKHEIFYANVMVSSMDKAILVNTYLSPGIYEIQINSGRRVLGVVQVEVVSQ